MYIYIYIYNPLIGLKKKRDNFVSRIQLRVVFGPQKKFLIRFSTSYPSEDGIISKISHATLITFPLFVPSFKNDFLGHLRAGAHQEQTPINKSYRYFTNKFGARGQQKILNPICLIANGLHRGPSAAGQKNINLSSYSSGVGVTKVNASLAIARNSQVQGTRQR